MASNEELVMDVADKCTMDDKLNKAGDKLVVVDFRAMWCGPCKMISPRVKELATNYSDVVFLKVDVDDNTETTEHYKIEAIPTFLFIRNKCEVDRLLGANKDKLEEKVKQHRNKC